MATLAEILADKNKPDDQKIVIEGVETTLGELRQGTLFQQDYTKKTMRLSEDRKKLDLERAEWDVARQEAERQLADLAKQIVQQNPQATKSELETAIEADPVYQRVHGRIGKIDETIAKLEGTLGQLHEALQKREMRDLEQQHMRVLSDLKREDPTLNDEELVQYAASYRIPRLDVAYRSMMFEKRIEEAKKLGREEGLKEGIEKGKTELSQPMLPSRRVLSTPLAEKPVTWDTAVDAALSDPEILQTLRGQG